MRVQRTGAGRVSWVIHGFETLIRYLRMYAGKAGYVCGRAGRLRSCDGPENEPSRFRYMCVAHFNNQPLP